MPERKPLPTRASAGPYSPWPELEAVSADGRLVFETDEYQLLLTRDEWAAWVRRTAARALSEDRSLTLAGELTADVLETLRGLSVEVDTTQNIAVLMLQLERLFADTAGEGAVFCDAPRAFVSSFAHAIETGDDNQAAAILDTMAGVMLGTLRAAFSTEAGRRGEQAPSHGTVRRRFIRGALLLSRLHAHLALKLAATPDLE